jgi:hypothetical protein
MVANWVAWAASVAQAWPMKTALHFLWSSIAATLSAMALLGLTLPLATYLITGTITGEGFWLSLVAMVVLLPMYAIIGGTVALPMAMVAGGAMLWGEKMRGRSFAPRTWIIAGLAAGVLVSLFVGTNDTDLMRLAAFPCLTSAAALGAWAFMRAWRRGGVN